MPSTTEASSWDFTPVIDLLYSSPAGTEDHHKRSNDQSPSIDLKIHEDEHFTNEDAVDGEQCGPRLGDFSNLWTFLAQSSQAVTQNDTPPPPDKRLDSSYLHVENITTSDVKLSQYDDLVKGLDIKDDVFVTSFTSHKEEAINVVEQNSLSEKNHPPVRILARPAPAPAVETSVIDGSEPSSYKTPRLAHSNLYSTPQKPPRSPPKGRAKIQPLIPCSSSERRSRLVDKLVGSFPAQKKLLLRNDCSLPTCDPLDAPANSIHVFVDASNIMIGFHDCIKVSRNIPITTRIPRVPLSFHNFSLVLERGRQPAKRVLVGSDRFPAIDEAERIGYEANILNRVHKSKEFTPARKKFRDGKNGFRNGNGHSNGNGQCSSGSETNAAPAREKWVEQAVDEILHLKILESIVDTEKPSTMVLATGDAAEAEYSGGFMKMVTRALQKGWTIELVSFSMNTSATYKRKEFRSTWGSKFKMIELDGYIEDLLDM
ncbi:hypothetical protein FQN54_000551 [Arachnomyces sp. PD_36]|nr:hypothetical protein FQN54_000551 [Arachnomyces sp. PD_36]